MPDKTLRVGLGTDIHRLESGRALLLGGVSIEFSSGLVGHSDADVLVHAVCDALLGAAALGDLGEHFPDDDPRYEGVSSLTLLDRVMTLLGEAGWRPVNVDCVVHAEAPRLAPYREAIRECIAEHLRLPITDVGIKAKTGEGLGPVGQGEAIAATCACLIAPLHATQLS
ncbi:MAG: 2-C-methyl-D-erythritol 2,4-cyclodiphosphate synthase [Candidatus Bipolaricaulota bacterium]|nr:MAG: 2-C-methyl-D-erythritol 2,4-cyclodiphosphate synthase [Candidatus Bipolaricaulota bacterium]